jgi:hypothetical protein
MLKAEGNSTIFTERNLTRTKYLVPNMNVKEIQIRQLTSGNLQNCPFTILNADAQEKGIINLEIDQDKREPKVILHTNFRIYFVPPTPPFICGFAHIMSAIGIIS